MTNKYNKYLLLISALIIALSATTIAESAQLPVTNTKISIRKNARFNNYDFIRLIVNVPSYIMVGQHRFIKIYDNNGDILFLGEVPINKLFSISVNKLKSAKKITIEIFSEDAADKPVVLFKKLRK